MQGIYKHILEVCAIVTTLGTNDLAVTKTGTACDKHGVQPLPVTVMGYSNYPGYDTNRPTL